VRDHQFIVIWAELYVAICHIGPPPPPKSWNRVFQIDREVTALDRMLCQRRVDLGSLSVIVVAKRGSDQLQGARSSSGGGGVWLHESDHVGGHQCIGTRVSVD
jgi:hypothetical protein